MKTSWRSSFPRIQHALSFFHSFFQMHLQSSARVRNREICIFERHASKSFQKVNKFGNIWIKSCVPFPFLERKSIQSNNFVVILYSTELSDREQDNQLLQNNNTCKCTVHLFTSYVQTGVKSTTYAWKLRKFARNLSFHTETS